MALGYRTRSDVIVNALAKLGVAISNQPPDLEDVQYVDIEIESIFRKLEATDVVFVADRGTPGPQGGNIPAELFDDLGSIVAELVSPKFGITADDMAKLVTRGLGVPPGSGAAAMSIHKIRRGRPTGEVLRVDYF
jgi:hypothetical protein